MKLQSIPRMPRVLLAGVLVLAVGAAAAASGFNVTKAQESLIAPGMSTADVQAALGRPSENHQYGSAPGRTFIYQVPGSQDTVFDIEFGADGKVASASERVEEVR